MRMEDELLADARREAEHAREELIKARDLLARVNGLLECREKFMGNPVQITTPEQRWLDESRAFMAETTLYPKAEASK